MNDDRRAARRYAHGALSFRRCGLGFCLGCWWRTLTGRHRRNLAALRAMADAHRAVVEACSHDWQPQVAAHPSAAVCVKCHAIQWRVRR